MRKTSLDSSHADVPLLRAKSALATVRLSTWLPIVLGFGVLLVGLIFWRLLVPLENDRVRLQTEKIGTSIVDALSSKTRGQFKTTLRQAERLARTTATSSTFREDSGPYLRDFPGILSIRQTRGTEQPLSAVRDGVSPVALYAAKPDLHDSAAPTEVANFAFSLSAPIGIDGNLVYFLDFYRTANDGPPFELTTVLDAKKWLGETLDSQTNFSSVLRDHDEVVYSSEDGRADSRWTRQFDVDTLGRQLRVQVTPQPQAVDAIMSHVPSIVLVGSISLALVLAIASHLAIIARERREMVASSIGELALRSGRQQNAEQARDAARRQLGSILESITDGFIILDEDWRYTYVNNVAATPTGSTPEQLLGKCIWDVFPDFAASPEAAQLRHAMQERVAVSFQRRTSDNDAYSLRAYPHLEGLALYFHDVTEQHKTADILAKNENLLRQSQSVANMGSFVRDLASDTEEWSNELFRIVGVEKPEAQSDLQFLHFVDQQDQSRVADAQAQLRLSGGETELKVRLITVHGQSRVASLRMRMHHSSAGESPSIAGTVQDISDRQRAESELALMLNQSRQQSAKFRALNRAMLLVSAKLGHPDLHQVLVEELRETVRAHVGVLHLFADQGLKPFTSFSDKFVQWANRSEAIRSLYLLGESACREKTIRLSQQQLQSHPLGAALNALTPDKLALRGLLSVALFDRDGNLLGYLQACDRIDDEFNADDEAVAIQFAQIASVAIGWARLIDDLRATQADLSHQLEEVDHGRSLLAEAEHVAKLGSWQIESGAVRTIALSDEAARVLRLDGAHSVRVGALLSLIVGNDGERLRGLLRSLLSGHIIEIDHEFRVRLGADLKWLHVKARANRDTQLLRLAGTVQDVTRQREASDMDRLNAQAFAGIAAGVPLGTSLNNVIELYENIFPDGLCSILLLDEDGRLRTAAAPRLAAAFNQAVDGILCGPNAGSCGTAAWLGQRVIVTDTQSDPLWADFADLAAKNNLRACWSTPIFDASRRVLGTFAVYYNDPRAPKPQELASVDRAAAVAAVAIVSQKSRRQIEDREQRFRSLFTYVPEAVFALDMKGIVVDCNDAAIRMTGFRRDQLLKNSIAMTVAPALRSTLMDHIALAASGSLQQIELQRQRPDGSRYLTMSTKTPIVVDGELVGIFSIVRDVTLERSNQYTLEEALRTVKGHNRELEEFAFVASHDLQEPLRKVRAFGDRLRLHLAQRADPESIDYIERMRNAAERMQRLIDDLLTYSRIGKRERKTQRVNLREVLNGVLADLETSIEQRNARIEFDELPTVEADETQMRQMLQNLISNSLKFGVEGRAPKISIRSETFRLGEGFDRRPWVRIVVSDNGLGFDNKYADRIFGAFQRLHGTGEFAGSGIGLAIVRRIVERHGGYVRAHGVVGEGATFTIEIPQSGSDVVTMNQVSEKIEAHAL